MRDFRLRGLPVRVDYEAVEAGKDANKTMPFMTRHNIIRR